MKRPNMGHLYGRRSREQQKDNTGKARQENGEVEAFCRKFGMTLAEKSWFDDGYSAYGEANWQPDAALGQFLAAAKKGVEICAGDSILIPEVTRLLRLKWSRAIVWVGQLFEAGVHIGDLSNMRHIRCDSGDIGDALHLLMGTQRGHDDSAGKSGMVQFAKSDRLREAMEGRAILTRHLPFWIDIQPCSEGDEGARWYGSIKKKQWGRLVVKKREESLVKEIFRLAAMGLRGTKIVRELQRQKQQPPTGKKFSTTFIQMLLTDRRVLGELPASRFSYHRHIKKCPGEPHPAIPGYYKEVVSEAEFYAAKGGGAREHARRGREAALPNVFKGMLFDALSGERYFLDCSKNREGTYDRKLRSLAIRRGVGSSRVFDYPWFERCILKELREVVVQDIIGDAADSTDTKEKAGRKEANLTELADLREFMRKNRSSPTLLARVLELEEENRQLEDELALAAHRKANPLAQAWTDQQSLAAAVDNAEDPVGVRLKLRQRLRETVDKIWLLVVPTDKLRHAVVQFDFKGGDTVVRRRYWFTYRPGVKTPRYSRPATCEPVLSRRFEGFFRGIDLSSPAEAAALAEVLASGEELAKFAISHSAQVS